jgi:hypothetical protein
VTTIVYTTVNSIKDLTHLATRGKSVERSRSEAVGRSRSSGG